MLNLDLVCKERSYRFKLFDTYKIMNCLLGRGQRFALQGSGSTHTFQGIYLLNNFNSLWIFQ